LSDSQAKRMREYFERGGFFMVDDFHNEYEWASFMEGMEKVIPNPKVIDLPDDAPIFHTVYDLSQRYRPPGLNVVHGDQIERDGTYPHWRAVVDDKDRVLVAICHNMDLGDAWEWAFTGVSGEVLIDGVSDGRQLRYLRDDALIGRVGTMATGLLSSGPWLNQIVRIFRFRYGLPLESLLC
jgi:hypothetical protein